MPGKVTRSKKAAPQPAQPYGKKAVAAKPAAEEKKENPLFAPTPRSFHIGGDIRPKRDLSRVIRWPRYVRIQRQRKVLKQRLKVPPALNQFTNTLDKNQATELFKLLANYVPETRKAKSQRIVQMATAKAEGKPVTASKPPPTIKFGLNHVTDLIESKKAKLVVIAHDVDPIELVVWLPALCRKMDVPYCIVKGKARLGALVHHKTATCLAITEVNAGDNRALQTLVERARAQFNTNTAVLRKWGGGIMGQKTQHRLAAREKAIRDELAKKASMM